ncbi:MAG TPA: pantoate--beta-alanine ligase [Verrucomicrobiae bacterium]|nr:pantoate--beta-alanine ligase [Verrucomicrobiae bacterium]
MRMVESLAGMRRLARNWQRAGTAVGLVPTMGALHAGHLSLVQEARRRVGRRGKVVVSIYVNPTQFAPNEDFKRYPRDLARDAALCHQEGVDVVFAPADAEMYPRNPVEPFSTYVVEERLSRAMEGASRPTHFRGVTTVVAKLFNLVQPTLAVFGAKDYQQAAIVRRMVRDLHFPLEIILAPTFREPDGLAMSSRNRYLAGPLREQALVLWRALREARAAVRQSRRPLSAARLRATLTRHIEQAPAVRVDYIEFFHPDSLLREKQVRRGVHMALAVRVGKTRLIDNARL